MSTDITPQTITQLAAVNRLSLSTEQTELLAKQCNAIVTAINARIFPIDPGAIEPLFYGATNPATRADNTHKTITRAELLKNAPETDNTFFIVPRIVQ